MIDAHNQRARIAATSIARSVMGGNIARAVKGIKRVDMAKYPTETDKEKHREVFKGIGKGLKPVRAATNPVGTAGLAAAKAGAKAVGGYKFGDSVLGKIFGGKIKSSAKAAEVSGTKQKGGDRFARAGAADMPKAPEQSKKMSKPAPAKLYATDKAPRRKPATGVSSGPIDKPTPNKSAAKSRADLGAFYLNATQHMDIHSRKKKK